VFRGAGAAGAASREGAKGVLPVPRPLTLDEAEARLAVVTLLWGGCGCRALHCLVA